MANVGNLFINVTGNTKGLTKALGSAKSKLTSFDRQIGRPKGDFMRRAKGRFYGAMAERQRFNQQMSQFIGPQRAGHVENIRGRMGKKERAARQAYRGAQREQVMGKMAASSKMMMTAVLGGIGISVTALVSMFNTARSQAKNAESAVEAFKYAGPMGGRIAAEEVQATMDALKAAQDPNISMKFLEKAMQKRMEQQTSIESGGMGASMDWDMFIASTGEAFAQALNFAGVIGSPQEAAVFANGGRNTGPVGTTGNSGGP